MGGSFVTRFEWLVQQMEKSVDDPDAHQIWPYACGGYDLSYGYLKFEGKQHLVHRVVWKLKTGEFPVPPLETRHKCGIGLCFNFYHLAVGTHSQNEMDKALHGTGKQGTGHHNAVLNEADVLEIRASKLGSFELSERYGVRQETINSIRRHASWAHI